MESSRVESKMLAHVTRTAARSARTTLDCSTKRSAWGAQKAVAVRRFASKKSAQKPPAQQQAPPSAPNGMPPADKVTREVLMHELKEIIKLVVGVRLVSSTVLQCDCE